MKLIYYIFLSAFLFGNSVLAQTNSDSLWSIWEDEERPDKVRLKAIGNFIWEGYLFTQPDSAFYFAQLKYDFAESKGLKNSMEAALNTQGISYAVRGNPSKALEYFHKGLKINEELDHKKGMMGSFNNIGTIYNKQGSYSNALGYFQKSLAIAVEVDDKGNKALLLSNIANIHKAQGNHKDAMDYCERSLKLAEETGDKPAIANAIGNIAILYAGLKNYPKALEFYQKSIELEEEMGRDRNIATTLGNIGNLYSRQGNIDKALEYQKKSLALNQRLDNNIGVAASLARIGVINKEQGHFGKAIRNCKESFDLTQPLNAWVEQKDACECLYNVYKSLSEHQKALEYFELLNIVDDSLNKTENAKKLQRFEFDQELLADSLRQEEERHIIALAHQAEVAEKDKTRNRLMGGGLLLLLMAGGLFSRNRYVNRSRKAIQKEKDRSEELLLNILPEKVAEELKEKGEAEAQLIDQVTVLFTDFKGFTAMSEKLSPKELVNDLNLCFSEFDRITAKYGIEKIKTIGDAYMAAGGLPIPNSTHATDVIKAALEMRDFVEAGKAKKMEAGLPYFEVRIGVHTGPVVAGIVGVKKFQYDIWGDTVNTASRMESSGEIGKVNISEATHDLVKNNSELKFTARGKIKAKGKGELEMYFVSGKN
ncbi:MAG: adenylate/guanylate cyclase domain-containing protein [Bacteroidota bacterium]